MIECPKGKKDGLDNIKKMYNPKSTIATEFICDSEIRSTMQYARENCGNMELVQGILDKARAFKGITHREAAVLLECNDPAVVQQI